MASLAALGLAATAGFVAHAMYFSHGERDLAAANIARLHLGLACIIPYLKSSLQSVPARQSIYESFAIYAAYTTALFTSIVFYRLHVSPLRHVPGPLRLRLSKLAHMWDMANNQNCKLLEELRKEYGNVVRTGPNEVTWFGCEAFYAVHGQDSKYGRAQYYDLLHPMVSLDTTRDPAVHAHRRKLWDQAFSIRSLERTEPIVYEHADKLVAQLQKRESQPLDISTWLEYYTFDLMGLFGLTVNFKNLDKGEHPILSLYHMAHRKLGPLAAVPWLKHLMMGIPYVERMKYYKNFMDWAHRELDRNIQNHKDEKRTNVIGYVLGDAMKHGGLERNWNFVLGDFVLVIVAGSDPVRQVLANMMYYLIQKPSHLAQLREELASIDVYNYKALQALPHLTACIYETLRLNPAVPSAGLRIPPKGGVEIEGYYIPEHTTIVTPQYSIFRDKSSFIQPEDWIPERFSTRPELVLNKLAFVPWSTGKMSCIGKNLSLMEIRVAAALIFTRFEFDFAPVEDGQRMFTEATDYFTTTPGPLNLVLKSRVDTPCVTGYT